MAKIIRTVCLFTREPDVKDIEIVNTIVTKLEAQGFSVQTRRICSPQADIKFLEDLYHQPDFIYGVGAKSLEEIRLLLPDFYQTNSTNVNLELSAETITSEHVDILFKLIRQAPARTFSFAYVFNNAASSPYMPSADYEEDGFALGLQPTDLSEGCNDLNSWLQMMNKTWSEINNLFVNDQTFLGIDASTAPMLGGYASFVNFMGRIGLDFNTSFTTDFYTRITSFIKEYNPQPIGLNGLMLPCLEDAELAKEYEAGNFSIERNIFVSLHSGLGIDTYPIGIDEKPERVLEILKLVQALSNKYQKPLSARFVSDGKTKIGDKTDFGNQYLCDVVVRAL